MSRKLVCVLSLAILLALASNGWAIDKWWNQDIGTTGGSATENKGKFAVVGDGADIWNAADGFQFVYKKLVGDGSMTARVVSQQATNEWAKAGVMIRETLEPGSKHCFMAFTALASHGVAFQNRTRTNSGTCYTASTDPGTINASLAYGLPFWVRIVREGEQLSGYISKDGANWTLVPPSTASDGSPNPQTNDMTDPLYIGLAVTSHSAGIYCTAEFDNISFTGNVIDKIPQVKAFKPVPADGTIGVAMPLLQWSQGETAQLHDVYLGTSPDLTAANLVASHQPIPMFFAAQGFHPGVTYYWRVDEIDKDGVTVYKGDVWSFMAQAAIAYYPTPADKANDISPATSLTWMPAAAAAKHRLYLSDSLDAVKNATTGADKGFVDGTTFAPATALESLKTYYWRVDETIAGAGVKAGPVWSFTTTLPVDDFESYTDDEGKRIYETWADGWVNSTGSMVGYRWRRLPSRPSSMAASSRCRWTTTTSRRRSAARPSRSSHRRRIGRWAESIP
jgi:hypothetical protein